MDQIFQVLLFDEVKDFIRSRGSLDQAKILATIATLFTLSGHLLRKVEKHQSTK